MDRGNSFMKPAWSAARLLGIAALAASLSISVTGCAKDSRQGAYEIKNVKPDQAGPAAPFGLNRVGRGNSYGTRSINMQDLNDAHHHGGGVINQANRENATIYGAESARSKVQSSQSIADAVTALDEVKSANVLVTDHNAYIAVVLEYGAGIANPDNSKTNNTTITDVSDQVKTKIADKVKTTHSYIKNVYISASPDFVERMRSFRQDIQNGKPVAGFVKEFYNVIERVFPMRAGNTNPVITP